MQEKVIDQSARFKHISMGNMLRREKAKLVINPAHKALVSRDLVRMGKVFFTEQANTDEIFVIDMEMVERGLPLYECVIGG